MSLPHSLRTAASPPCHQCGNPILRVEITQHRDRQLEVEGRGDEKGEAWVMAWITVCNFGHRVQLEPLGSGPL